MGRYVEVTELKLFVNSQTISDDGVYEEAIDAATQYLDGETKRTFTLADTTEPDPVSTARVYRPDRGSASLFIHDCVSIVSVVENGVTLTANTDYIAEPLNGMLWSGETRPYNELVRYPGCWYTDGPKATVTVTAVWGWASIPDMAKLACKVAAKAYLDARDVRLGLAALSEQGGVSERESKAVRDFIRHYRGAMSIGIA